MKAIALALVVVGVWCEVLSTPLQTKERHEHIKDFVDLIPTKEITAILDSANQESYFHSVVEYIFSDEFQALVLEVENIPEVENVINELDGIGVPIRNLLVLIHVSLKLPPAKYTIRFATEGSDVMQEIIEVLPLEDIKALYEYKMHAYPEFREMIDYIKGPVFKGSIDAMEANIKIKEIVAHIYTKGIDVQAVINFLKSIFGFIFWE